MDEQDYQKWKEFDESQYHNESNLMPNRQIIDLQEDSFTDVAKDPLPDEFFLEMNKDPNGYKTYKKNIGEIKYFFIREGISP